MTVNLLFGLPFPNPSLCNSVLSDFFALEGRYIVCGGTTAQYVANFLQERVVLDLHYVNPAIPPISHIKGVHLVTEGIVTMSAVLEKFNKNSVKTSDYDDYEAQDGASLIYRALLEADEINFFVSRFENPQNKEFLELKSKVQIETQLVKLLTSFGKKVCVRDV